MQCESNLFEYQNLKQSYSNSGTFPIRLNFYSYGHYDSAVPCIDDTDGVIASKAAIITSVPGELVCKLLTRFCHSCFGSRFYICIAGAIAFGARKETVSRKEKGH